MGPQVSILVGAGDSNTTETYVAGASHYLNKIAAHHGFSSVVNSAISGQSAVGILNNVNSQILQHSAFATIIPVGTNDADAAYNNNVAHSTMLAAYLTTMASLIDAVKPYTNLQIWSAPMSRNGEVNTRLASMAAGLRCLCDVKDVGYFGQYEQMERDSLRMPKNEYEQYFYSPTSVDDYHLGATGHDRVFKGWRRGQMFLPLTANGVALNASALTGYFGNACGNTFRVWVKHGALNAVPTLGVKKIRVTLQAPSDESTQIGCLYAGPHASGSNWSASAFFPLTYQGISAYTVPQNEELVLDWVPFSGSLADGLVFSGYVSGGSSADKLAGNSSTSNFITSIKSGNEASVLAPSGFTSFNDWRTLIKKIETDGF